MVKTECHSHFYPLGYIPGLLPDATFILGINKTNHFLNNSISTKKLVLKSSYIFSFKTSTLSALFVVDFTSRVCALH